MAHITGEDRSQLLLLPDAVDDYVGPDLAQRLGITTTTLYMYVNRDGSVKEPGQKLLDAKTAQQRKGWQQLPIRCVLVVFC